jgi:hypothetical protein
MMASSSAGRARPGDRVVARSGRQQHVSLRHLAAARRAGRLGFWACSWRSRSCASVKDRRGKPGPRPRRVGSYPIPRRPHHSLCPTPGRVARGKARGATIAAHGMTTLVRTNGDAPVGAGASAAGPRAKAQMIVVKKQADAGSSPHNDGAQLLMMRVAADRVWGDARPSDAGRARDRIPRDVLAARPCTAGRDGRQTRLKGPTSPCPMFASRWRAARCRNGFAPHS